MLAKKIYGPKNIADEFIEISIKVIEIDIDENEDQKSFIGFVQQIAKPFFLADPVTASEITLAAEVAKTLIDLNQNDYIIDYNFTLVAGESIHKHTLPLMEGSLVMVNREKVRDFSNVYFNNSRQSFGWLNPFKLGMDILFIPIVAMNSLTDNVTALALKRFQEDYEGIYTNNDKNNPSLLLSLDTHEVITKNNGNEIKPYNDKSWLVMSFHKGKDTTNWDKNKLISASVEDVTRLLRKNWSDVFKNRTELKNAINNLTKVKVILENGNIYPSTIKSSKLYPYEFTVKIPSSENLVSINYYIKNKEIIQIPNSVIRHVPENEGGNKYTFEIKKPTTSGASVKLDKGEYSINVVTKTGKTFTYSFSIVE
jgi:hypothetical protein